MEHYSTQKNGINSSLFYRLIDDEPHLKKDRKSHQQMSERELHEEIRSNLESILNTRSEMIFIQASLVCLEESLLTYGIEDFSRGYLGNQKSQARLYVQIKRAIERFEPRLQKVSVTPMDADSELDRILKLRI